MKKVAILGSTGSVGTQTLDVIRQHPQKFKVVSLVAYSNEAQLLLQAREFDVPFFALIEKDGLECLIDAVKNCDIVVVATRGIVALPAVLFAIEHNIDVAIANKEVLVCGGGLVVSALKNSKSKLLPVDSEHSAIFQCLNTNQAKPKKLVLTASGGAFWNLPFSELQNVTAKQALKHPNWSMGQKITIDSATMINKTFEVLEAKWLFDVNVSNIEIVVHRQSIVHSLVEFVDRSVLAQLCCPDMRLPIQFALSFPERLESRVKQLNLFEVGTLTFEKCDLERFPCASLAFEIADKNPLLPTVLNAANDVCVEYFLKDRLAFLDYYPTLKHILNIFEKTLDAKHFNLENIFAVDSEVKSFARNYLNGEKN